MTLEVGSMTRQPAQARCRSILVKGSNVPLTLGLSSWRPRLMLTARPVAFELRLPLEQLRVAGGREHKSADLSRGTRPEARWRGNARLREHAEQVEVVDDIDVGEQQHGRARRERLAALEEEANQGRVAVGAADRARDGEQQVGRREVDLLLGRVLVRRVLADLADVLVLFEQARVVDDGEDWGIGRGASGQTTGTGRSRAVEGRLTPVDCDAEREESASQSLGEARGKGKEANVLRSS